MRDFERLQRQNSVMSRVFPIFFAVVLLLVIVSFVWQGVYHFTNMGPCNDRGGYWVNNQCVKDPVIVHNG